ncbi:hypothetical protein SEA_ZOOMAN_48 [Microbacterium phage Zooman]|nr:hypothetical protein SEA_ZOOMAN_48 [Microbacterium phage Zooman]
MEVSPIPALIAQMRKETDCHCFDGGVVNTLTCRVHGDESSWRIGQLTDALEKVYLRNETLETRFENAIFQLDMVGPWKISQAQIVNLYNTLTPETVQ